MNVEQIRQDFVKGRFEFSRHAFIRSVERDISTNEIIEAGSKSEIIEEYPDDKYLPSCLAGGFTQKNRPLHMQVCYSDSNMLKIITLYEPDKRLWHECRKRR